MWREQSITEVAKIVKIQQQQLEREGSFDNGRKAPIKIPSKA
jgi:hypothetical protein